MDRKSLFKGILYLILLFYMSLFVDLLLFSPVLSFINFDDSGEILKQSIFVKQVESSCRQIRIGIIGNLFLFFAPIVTTFILPSQISGDNVSYLYPETEKNQPELKEKEKRTINPFVQKIIYSIFVPAIILIYTYNDLLANLPGLTKIDLLLRGFNLFAVFLYFFVLLSMHYIGFYIIRSNTSTLRLIIAYATIAILVLFHLFFLLLSTQFLLCP